MQYVFAQLPDDSPLATDAPMESFVAQPAVKSFAIGGSGSGVTFHEHHSAFTVLVFGKKRWMFFDVKANRDYANLDFANRNNLDMEKTNMDFLGSGPRRGDYRTDKDFRQYWSEHGWECTQEPGDLMYVPAGINHAVVNIGETVSIVSERCTYAQREDFRSECPPYAKNDGRFPSIPLGPDWINRS